MSVIMYTTGCPKCNVLEKKLLQKNINFIKIDDIDEIRRKGFASVPYLIVDDNPPMNFSEAVNWVNNLEE